MPEIPHVLKVRVMAELNQRIQLLQKFQKVSRDEATAFIKKEDRERAHWTQSLYKIDINDSQIYDIVLNIGRLTISDACELLCAMAQSPTFKATPASTKAIRDLALSSRVRAALQVVCKSEVSANDGIVFVKVPAQKIRKTGYSSPKLQTFVKERIREDLMKEIEGIVKTIPDIKEVVYEVDLPYYS
jgi:hypothetical protein